MNRFSISARSRLPRWQCRVLRAAVAVGMLAFAGPLAAAPSHEEPAAPLEVRDVPTNQQLQQQAQTLYVQIDVPVQLYLEQHERGQLRLVKPRLIGDAYVDNVRLKRLAKQLIWLGEPAGYDFQLRATQLDAQIGELVDAYRLLPGVSAQLGHGYQIFRNEAQKHAKTLVRVQQLGEQALWERAESELYSVLDELMTMAVWYNHKQRRAVLHDYYDASRAVEDHLDPIRRAAAQESLAQRRAELAPKFDAALQQLQQAARHVSQNGKANYAGGILTGPQVVERFGETWRKLHHATLQCHGLDWARGSAARSDLEALQRAHRDFTTAAIAALADLVAADAVRESSDAVERYQQYLAALAPLVAITGDDQLETALQSPLDALAAGSPQLAEDVAAYRAATDDLLRWRSRLAEAYAEERSLPPLEVPFLAAAQAQPPAPGLVSVRARSTEELELHASVPQIMPRVAEQLMNQRVQVIGTTGLGPQQPVTIAHYDERAYTQIGLPEQMATETARLRRDLLVDPQHPPQSLAAAVALASAELGNLQRAGGVISGVYLEPLSTRFATLKAAGWTLVPLGRLPAEPRSMAPIRQVLMRFRLEPEWLQHRHFFIDLGAPAPPKLAQRD